MALKPESTPAPSRREVHGRKEPQETVSHISRDLKFPTSAGLRHLRALPQLEKLILVDTLIDDEAIPYLTAMPNLKEMQFSRVMVSRAAINEFIKSRPKCQVSMGFWAEHIQQCKEQIVKAGGRIEVDPDLPGEPVVALDLSGVAVNEQRHRSLGAFIRLRRLNLSGATINDASAGELHRLTRLRELNLTGADVSENAVQEFGEALPHCKIVR
jgi:hypothetical protein